jgi:ABC-2 type transport system ATP-binding protein
LLPLQEGTVTLDGISLRSDLAGIRQRLGVVFQSPSLDKKLTVRENMMHQGHLYGLYGAPLKERIAELTRKFKIDDRLKDKVETLSGGLQRRVEVAKGLLHRPALLILDEPTTGLDPAARLELWTYLQDINKRENITILVTTHLMDEAERCNRLLLLDRGLRITLDTPHALKSALRGSVITIQSDDADKLKEELATKLSLEAKVVIPGSLRIETPGNQSENGPKLVAQIVAAFPNQVESITLSQPTLEDVFIHLTGRRFEI